MLWHSRTVPFQKSLVNPDTNFLIVQQRLTHKVRFHDATAAAADRACSAFVRSSATLRITLGREPGIVSLRGDVEEVVPTWLRGRGGDAAMAEAPSS
jgi:hypothetical protein